MYQSSERLFKEKRRLAREVLDILVKIFPVVEGRLGPKTRFNRTVVEAGFDLAWSIQTSALEYKFVPAMEAPIVRHKTVYRDELSKCGMVDVATGKTLKPESPVHVKSSGAIGEEIMLLAPALLRRNIVQDWIELVQEVKLVELYRPLGRRVGRSCRDS